MGRHLYGFDGSSNTLTGPERESLLELYGINHLLFCKLRDATCYEAAFHMVHVHFIETWAGGAAPGGFRYQCNESGIEARMPGGNQGRVTWREIIEYARAKAVQGQLL